MFDEKGILDHLMELKESLRDWDRYQSISLEELHADRDKRNMVLHAMLISTQSAVDITHHIISDKGFRKPSTYRESFEILYEEGIISKNLSDKLSDLAGFRTLTSNHFREHIQSKCLIQIHHLLWNLADHTTPNHLKMVDLAVFV